MKRERLLEVYARLGRQSAEVHIAEKALPRGKQLIQPRRVWSEASTEQPRLAWTSSRNFCGTP